MILNNIMKKPQTVLSKLHVGDSCVIESFTDEVMKQKLLEMGCLPGETIVIDRFAPLGCPMSIIVSGSTLSLRVEEAAAIIVKQLN
jgi:ferrous iron transport protein A